MEVLLVQPSMRACLVGCWDVLPGVVEGPMIDN